MLATATVTISLMVMSVAPPTQPSQSRRPSFAGHWVIAPASAALSQGGGQILPICRLECVITQDDDLLIVSTPGGQAVRSYHLSGSPVKSTSEVLGRTVETTDTARWEGSMLVLIHTTSTGAPAKATRVETRLRLSLENGVLVIDRTITQPRGAEERARFEYQPKK
jgi:hypothetical protein